MAAIWGRTLRLLVERDLLDGESALDGRISVDDRSRSNQIGVVSLDGCPLFVLKHDAVAVDEVHPYDAEVAAYRWLAGDPATAALAPALVLATDGHVLVLEAIVGSRPLHEVLAASTDSGASLKQLGRHLGTLHSARTGRGVVGRRPWVLGVADRKTPPMLAGDPEISAMVNEVAEDIALRRTFAEFQRVWRPQTTIHGDVKFDNVLVGTTGTDGEPRMWLLDWELAGLGLPAWDLAGVVDGLLVPALVGLDIDSALDHAGRAAPAIEAHRAIVGPALAPDTRDISVATIVRLVQSAIQILAMRHSEPSATAAVARLVLDGARALAGRGAGDVLSLSSVL